MSKRETPYDWCKRVGAKVGDWVRTFDAERGWILTFTIVRIDDDARTVTWSLTGVWTAREWREMDRECEYELVEGKGA